MPPPEYADLIPAGRPSPPTVPGGYVLPVAGPRGTAGYILALESPDAVPAGVSVVQHIATVAALQLSMLAHEREMVRREGAETLAQMLQGLLDPAVAVSRLVANGFALDQSLRLAVVRPRHTPADDDSVADALATSGLPHLVLRQRDDLFVLVHDDDSAIEAVTGALNATVGLSRPFIGGGSLTVARREARWALTRAIEAGRNVAAYGDDRTERWLTGEPADLRALAAQVLGAVIDYDREHAQRPGFLRPRLAGTRPADRAGRCRPARPSEHSALPSPAVRALERSLARLNRFTGRSLARSAHCGCAGLTAQASAAERPSCVCRTTRAADSVAGIIDAAGRYPRPLR